MAFGVVFVGGFTGVFLADVLGLDGAPFLVVFLDGSEGLFPGIVPKKG